MTARLIILASSLFVVSVLYNLAKWLILGGAG